MMMENDTPINVSTAQTQNAESYIYLGQQYSPKYQIKIKTRIFKEEFTTGFNGNIGTCLAIQFHNAYTYFRSSSNDIRRGNMGIRQPDKEASRCTRKDGWKEISMLNITCRERKTNISVREKTNVEIEIEQVRRRNWTWAGSISRIRVEYEITDGHRVSPPGNLTKGNDLEGDWRDDGQAT